MASAPALEWAGSHGGKRRRQEALERQRANAAEGPRVRYDPLATELLEMWACQELSAVAVQKLAAAAERSDPGHPEIKLLAGLGAHGRHANHCNRDLLLRFNFEDYDQAPHEDVELPMVNPKGNAAEVLMVPTSVQFPHDVFGHLATNDLPHFRELFGDAEDVEAWWRNQPLDDPKLYRHPLFEQPDWGQKCIPGKIHSDCMEVTNNHSLHAISYSSFFSVGMTLCTQLYFGSCVKDACCSLEEHGVDTMHVLFRMLAWSLAACLYNQHPVLDWNMNPWADPTSDRAVKAGKEPLSPDGFFFAILGLCADLDELCNQFKLAHFNSLAPCFWCPADCDLIPWTDLARDACWCALHYKPPTDGSVLAPPNAHPVWSIPGVNRFSVLWDTLHGLDLGPTAHVNGNVLLELTQDARIPGGSMRERLGWVWHKILEAYPRLGVQNRLDNLSMSMFTDPDSTGSVFPKLKCKANEARHVLPCLLEVLHDDLLFPPRDNHERCRLAAVTELSRFYGILDEPVFHLRPSRVAEGKRCIQSFLDNYVWLTDEALENMRMRWQLTIKFHYFRHQKDLLQFLNPKYGSCYPGESFVGKLARISHSCSYGKPAYRMGCLVMEKVQMVKIVEARRSLL